MMGMTDADLAYRLIEKYGQPGREELRAILRALEELRGQVTRLTQNQTNFREELMGVLDDKVASLTQQIDEVKAQNDKALVEIKTEFEKLKEAQITPEELEAAKAEAKAAGKAEGQAEHDAAVDAAFASLSAKVAEAKASTQAIDDLVADVVVPPPPPDVEPGTGEPSTESRRRR